MSANSPRPIIIIMIAAAMFIGGIPITFMDTSHPEMAPIPVDPSTDTEVGGPSAEGMVLTKPSDPNGATGPSVAPGSGADARTLQTCGHGLTEMEDEGPPEIDDGGPQGAAGDTRAGSRSDLPLIDEVSLDVVVEPGEHFYVSFDPETGEVETSGIPDPEAGLSTASSQALDAAPQWMRGRLAATLAGCADLGCEAAYAAMINDAHDTLTDEVAFTIAWTHPRMLQYLKDNNHHTIITENAQNVYAVSMLGLGYAHLVEKSDYTTVEYTSTGGTQELPKMVYYLDVVYPRSYLANAVYYQGDHWRALFKDDSRYTAGNLVDHVSSQSTVRGAADAVGDWIQSVMTFEYGTNYVQPVQIYKNPVGSCGQYSIITTAAARTVLIPTRSVTARAEDHEWNEFFDSGSWVMWDNSLGEIGSNPHYPYIDMPDVMEPVFASYGGLSVVYQFRSDENVFETTQYTDTCTLEITVEDYAGNPLDGAQVRLFPAARGTNQPRGECFWNYTDSKGVVRMTVGDNMDYFARAEHPSLGNQPPGTSTVALVARDTEPGKFYTAKLKYEESSAKVPALDYTATGADTEGNLDMTLEYSLWREDRYCANSLTKPYDLDHHYLDSTPMRRVDFFTAPEEEYQKFSSGSEFECGIFVGDQMGAQGAQFIKEDLENRKWYAVWSNIDSTATTKRFSVTASVRWAPAPSMEITSPAAAEAALPHSGEVEVSGIAACGGTPAAIEVTDDGGTTWSDVDEVSALGDGWSFGHTLVLDGLATGEHDFTFAVEDGNGLRAQDDITIMVDGEDPAGTIDAPAEGAVVMGGGVIAIAGTAEDDLDLVGGELKMVAGGVPDPLLLPGGVYTGLPGAIDRSTGGEERSPGDGERSAGPGVRSPETTSSVNITSIIGGDGGWSHPWNSAGSTAGQVDLFITAWDSSGRAGYGSSYFFLDNDPPLLNLSTPGGAVYFEEGEDLVLNGTAFDDVALATLDLLVDGEKEADLLADGAFGEDGPGTWEYELDTDGDEGEYLFTLTATDLVGNTESRDVTVWFDAEEPEVGLDEPEDGAVFALGDRVELEGYAEDDLGIGVLGLQLAVDGGAVTPYDLTEELDDEEFTFTLDTMEHGGGLYTLILTAADPVGRTGESTITITIDAEDPGLTIDEAPEDATLGEEVVLEGTARDDVGVVSVEVSIDGGKYRDADLDGEEWSFEWNTAREDPGLVTIDVRATDVVGNYVVDSVDINLVEEDGGEPGDGAADGNDTDGGDGGTGGEVTDQGGSGAGGAVIAAGAVAAAVLIAVMVLLALMLLKKKPGPPTGPAGRHPPGAGPPGTAPGPPGAAAGPPGAAAGPPGAAAGPPGAAAGPPGTAAGPPGTAAGPRGDAPGPIGAGPGTGAAAAGPLGPGQGPLDALPGSPGGAGSGEDGPQLLTPPPPDKT